MEWGGGIALRGLLLLCGLLGVLVFGWLASRNISSRRQVSEAPALTINKQPVAFANHTFSAETPPADMPPLNPGETAECDSTFGSSASVHADSRQTDPRHATVTITQIEVTLQLHINMWGA